MDIANILGIAGAAIILLAFVLNQNGTWSDKHIRYDSANVIGSVLLALSAFLIQGWAFVLLNLVWAAVSLRDVVKAAYGKEMPPVTAKPGQPKSVETA
ncbi:MAG: hypothetical protein TR69_WS6001000904 [candidate division WS6 bacterium OLB20]|uniref:CBU-0592-like domain-containing protein n=1 Tax=candidate division WS6 bacterium OLB20 TaxID=1617426 RepID=A0A136LZ16_9BACT|nr:MAG: hypothetical protein TR69_WS6001000904 [candidate division WS6 bacterium OLB20]